MVFLVLVVEKEDGDFAHTENARLEEALTRREIEDEITVDNDSSENWRYSQTKTSELTKLKRPLLQKGWYFYIY